MKLTRLIALALALALSCASAHAATLGNLACVQTTTTGTGTITLGSAISAHVSFADAGIPDGATVSYGIEDGAASEAGRGTYDADTGTLTRGAITSTNSNNEISLSGTATVCVSAIAEDFTDRLEKSQNLADVDDAATAFGNIKQSATTSATGVAETATDGECEAGTDTARYCTPSGVKAAVAGVHTIWVPATAMWAGSCAPGTFTDSGWAFKYAACDPSSSEFMLFMVAMPKNWDEGNITAQFYWSHPSTTTNFAVVWGLACNAISDDDSEAGLSASYTETTDTGGTTSDLYVSDATSGFTPAGTPAAGDMLICSARRNGSSGSDTLAVDAYLHGVKVNYTSDATNDD
jgi:hypothetical protein